MSGKLKATVGLFEVDEANLRLIAPELLPAHIVVLNLFRDQLDRYGELDTTAAVIGEGIAGTKARLHLNADDPLVADIAKYATDPTKVSFFGVGNVADESNIGEQTAIDSDRCPQCKAKLTFSRTFFAHIGHYFCPNKDFSRPRPQIELGHFKPKGFDGSDLSVRLGSQNLDVSFPLPGLYNAYNALAAISVANALGIHRKDLVNSLSAAEPAFGRVERVQIEGRQLYLLLVKNPAGFAQVLETFLISPTESNVLFAVNDLDADGRDVSWLWDVPLEALPEHTLTIASGIRGSDMALRLKYAGFEPVYEEDLGLALKLLIERTAAGGACFVLPTYTAMLSVRRLLSKITHIDEI
jgi:UDP-N-acetylmuramyl tripeptide synthase